MGNVHYSSNEYCIIQVNYDIIFRIMCKQTKSILVAISSSHAASRQKLRGIYRYAVRKDDWDITLVRSAADLSDQIIAECSKGSYDGCILSSEECARQIAETITLKTPIVVIEGEIGDIIAQLRQAANTQVLTTDNIAIARMAAEHFRSLGRFASFAYIPDELGRYWSAIREKAFMDAIHADRRRKETYNPARESLAGFLMRLEPPVAVFAAWDFMAAKVVRACHAAGLSVPSQVSVIGVDDDDMICESVRPPLSTILVDRVKQGFVAAQTLNAMMNSRKRDPGPKFVCRPIKVVERESTAHLSPGGGVIARARQFIADHAEDGIDVQDVADAIHVSRRLLDLRISQSGLGTVAEMIRMRKLAAVKRLLKQTPLSDARIAARTGFKNVGTLRNLFRSAFGMSMRAWRADATRAASPLP